MRTKVLFLLFLAIQLSSWSQSAVLSTKQKLELLEKHDTAFQALNVRVRDPFILLAPDGYYYLTGTTAGSHWGDTVGIKLWRSSDLAKWTDLGYVWQLYTDDNYKNDSSWHFHQKVKRPEYKNPRAIWAPEIHYINGTFWLTHCMNISGHGLLKSKTGKAEGPYEVLPPMDTKGIDAHLFQDDDGTVYYGWQANILAPMTRDMTQLAAEAVKLKHKGNHPMGYEGILMLKIDKKYVFIASGRYGYEPSNTYDLYYAVSDNIYGPYGLRRMALKNAGHGNIFQDKNGNWWSTAFDHEFCEKGQDKWSLWLVPVNIETSTSDVIFQVLDNRFEPTNEDQDVVKKLSNQGIPEQWQNQRPWWRPNK